MTAMNGKLYLVGGQTGSGLPTPAASVYDPATGRWTSLPPMASARYQATAVGLNGLLYVIGGYGYNATGPVIAVEVYNPVSNTWRTVTAMPTARWSLGAGAINGRIYAIGGKAVGALGEVTLAANQVYIP